MYFGFGGDDFYTTVDLPGNTEMAAGALTTVASGAVNIRTVVLLTPEEVDAAVKMSADYQAPGACGSAARSFGTRMRAHVPCPCLRPLSPSRPCPARRPGADADTGEDEHDRDRGWRGPRRSAAGSLSRSWMRNRVDTPHTL